VRVQAFCRHAQGITGSAPNLPAPGGAGGWRWPVGVRWLPGMGCGLAPAVACGPVHRWAVPGEPYTRGRVRAGQGGLPGVVDSPGAARQGCRVHCPPQAGTQRRAVGVQPDACWAGAPAAAGRKHRPARLKGGHRFPAGAPACAVTGRRDAGPWRAGEDAVGGRHEAPKPGTDVFMAVVVLALLALLASVVIPAALGG
jgi:hypothetical protein